MRNITEEFFEAGEKDISKALQILQLNKEEFKKEKDIVEYDNNANNADYDYFFTPNSKLDRFYSPIVCENNLETFAVMLLDNALDYRKPELKLDILDHLLDNRNEFNIKDETVVQLLVEKVYQLEAFSENYFVTIEKLNQNLSLVIEKLVEKNISFDSDVQGYIPQIITFNNLENEKQLLKLVKENGSNIASFVQRYENTNNWLNKDDKEELLDYDINYDRGYNIYKKFDEFNNMSEKKLDKFNTIQERKLQLCKEISMLNNKKLKM